MNRNERYGCGHESKPVLITKNHLTLSNWITWKDTVGFEGNKSICFRCYCKKQKASIDAKHSSSSVEQVQPKGKDDKEKNYNTGC